MKLTGTIISIGRHNRDGETIDGVLIEVPREQLQRTGVLYQKVTIHEGWQINTERKSVHPDYHAKVENPEVFNVDLLERRVEALLAAGDRLNTLLCCEAGIEDSEEWSNSTREMQLALIAEARREWRNRREG